MTSPNYYLTHPHACSYLEDLASRNVVLDPELSPDDDLYNLLLNNGFRRSGQHLYRPQCEFCSACIPLRVNTTEFALSRSQKRVRNANTDLDVRLVPAMYTDEHFSLYKQYQTRTHGGEMAKHTAADYQDFLITAWALTHFVEFRLAGELIAVAVVDETSEAYSAVYTYYSPDHPKRSLGTLAVLWQLEHALAQKKQFVYLGYWIEACNKMNYKRKFQPNEGFVDGAWLPMV